MRTLKRKMSPGKHQRGVLTLAISIVILMLSTLVTFTVSKAILMEQKITNNEMRAKQAFEAAEAGMLAAVSYIQNDPDVNVDGVVDPVFDTNADGLGDSNSTTIGTGSVTVTTTALSSDLTAITIEAQGFSDDRSATRTITQNMVTINPLPNAPENPVIARGGVIVGGSATVHNPEGHSTIWSGNDIDLGSNNSTSTEVPDVSDIPSYPGCMDVPMTCALVDASNRNIAGVDIIENDSSLGSLTDDQFFTNFFGLPPATYRSSMVTIDSAPADVEADADTATHEVIWVEGDASINGITVGCAVSVSGSGVCSAANTKPSIIIINGDLDLGGTPQFYGILYVTGNVTGTGNTTVYGAMVIGGSSSTTGSLDIWYSSEVLANTSKAGASASSAGTWKDF